MTNPNRLINAGQTYQLCDRLQAQLNEALPPSWLACHPNGLKWFAEAVRGTRNAARAYVKPATQSGLRHPALNLIAVNASEVALATQVEAVKLGQRDAA